jgi:hypothetical protein
MVNAVLLRGFSGGVSHASRSNVIGREHHFSFANCSCGGPKWRWAHLFRDTVAI